MNNSLVKIKRALLSVSDKTGLDVLAQELNNRGVEIISSGGTAKFIMNLGLPVTPIEKVTGNPEAFAGRMKTLSFQVASGLLFKRDSLEDLRQAEELKIEAIDLVVCNLYPFEEVAKRGGTLEELVENIDIGGPTMVRAAAKNYAHVTVSTDPAEYRELIDSLVEFDGATDLNLRKKLCLQAFRHTALYDSLIASELERENNVEGKTFCLSPMRAQELRYGENPHQKGYVYQWPLGKGLAQAKPIQGKALSYNNLLDADAALRSALDLHQLSKNGPFKSVVTIIKHSNPCGAAMSNTSLQALEMAWAGDPISSFGSIICFNRELDRASADWLSSRFVEVICAPSFSDEALEIFAKKKNLRLIPVNLDELNVSDYMVRSITGGWVVQEEDEGLDEDYKVVTDIPFDDARMELAKFGSMVCKHLKSNAIGLFSKSENGFSIIGAGMGNPNRLISVAQSIEKARENGVENLSEALLVSDAFFPFADNIEATSKAGIKFIVQPGGSIKDQNVIDACNETGTSMVFTGRRHFRH
ncbi:MAG: bifunctional phosphoribosylaminoimidazolecarboxamide formyltransferase/IMP cyclohydrolase PurH [Epsilonproteobacteria bacterium]|nr:MAG: bifunctional phosphoribosylaminoimidazolecarboxamide formyltransferase/IMP cyclohydrolase PurH [Campylobacterota bacterium]RLA63687.1 MAG: bifunctional phosphoribosylaminoimidazolecarboxamide formyltransferase/IMP cyclohydrolase PurH [Campylobacterota bacterium]